MSDAIAPAETRAETIVRHAPTVIAAGLVVQVSALAILHGAFYTSGFLVAEWSTALLVLIAIATRQPVAMRSATVVGPLALGGSALVSALAAGDVGAGFQTVRVMLLLAGIALVVGGMARPQRILLVQGLVLTGCVLSLIGFYTVIRRHVPEATFGRDLWRAGSTLWYPNALAAIVGPLALVSLVRQMRDPAATLHRVTTYVLLCGLISTWSRGAAVGLLAGLVVCGGTLGLRPLRDAFLPALLGAGVFLAGLLPAITGDGATALIPWCALIAGGVVTVALGRAPDFVQSLAQALALVAVGVAVVAGAASSRLSEDLSTGAASDRLAIWETAAGAVADKPLLGVGPGKVTYVFRSGVEPRLARYAHNDYLELTVEQGLVGLAVIIAAAAALARAAGNQRPHADPALWAGAAAALSALAVHGSLDFVSRFPLILMIGAVLATVLTTGRIVGDPTEGGEADAQ